MNNLEVACEGMEAPAEALNASLRQCQTLVRKVQRAVQAGDMRVLPDALADLVRSVGVLQSAANDAKDAWPHTPDEVTAYIQDGWLNEMLDTAGNRELDMFPLPSGDALIAPPLDIRVLPESRSATLGGKRVGGLRPSFLADAVQKAQARDPKFNAAAFLTRLYKMMCGILGKSNLHSGDLGTTTVLLDRLYRLYTEYPGVRREYSRLDFARDLFLLDASDVVLTRTISSRSVHLAVSFPSATGTRGSASNVFTYIRGDGAQVDFYSIRFDEVESESDTP
ncbi:MAG: hypothetical protein OXC13_03800 [Caldilineaceae bacterium]|nr:hypothetical protein [Caldilineaceae bacterium]